MFACSTDPRPDSLHSAEPASVRVAGNCPGRCADAGGRKSCSGCRASAHQSDTTLIQACLAGKQRAWDELVERYGRLVYSIARRYRLNDADSDDVFQAVFLILFRQLSKLRDQTRLSAWLITTAHRECWRVGKNRETYADLDQAIADVAAPSDTQLLTWERQHLVRQALEQLGGRCRELLEALFFDESEPSYEAVASRLRIPLGSIGPTRARCFQKLERILSELGVSADAEASAVA